MVALQTTKITRGGFSRLPTLDYHIDDNEFPYLAIPLSKRRSWSLVLRLVCFYGRYVREITGILCIGATQDTNPYSCISKVSFPTTDIRSTIPITLPSYCPVLSEIIYSAFSLCLSKFPSVTTDGIHLSSSDPFVARWCRDSACVYRILVFCWLGD